MKRLTAFLLLGFLFNQAIIAAPPVEEGKTIFTSRCAACHNINKVLTGPALAGVDERRSMDWIISFVQSSQTLVKKGDKDAVALFEQFNKIPMPDHTDLTAENIKSVVAYIKSEAKGPESKAPAAKPEEQKGPDYKALLTDYKIIAAVAAVIGLLVVTLLFAAQVKQQVKQLKARQQHKGS